MGPIELLWLSLFFMVGAIGLVRGFLRELGVTTTVLVAIYVISEWLEKRELADKLVSKAAEAIGLSLSEDPDSSLIRFCLYTFIILFVAFISYHGETLGFVGTPPKGVTGVFLNLMGGALNGYLIVGTIWFYMDVFDYPIKVWDLFTPPLTPFAETLRSFLFFNLIPANFREPVLIFLIVFLIMARVIK